MRISKDRKGHGGMYEHINYSEPWIAVAVSNKDQYSLRGVFGDEATWYFANGWVVL